MSKNQIIENMAIVAANTYRNRCGIINITIDEMKDIGPIIWEHEMLRAEAAYKASGAEHIPALVEALIQAKTTLSKNTRPIDADYNSTFDDLWCCLEPMNKQEVASLHKQLVLGISKIDKALEALPPELRGE